MDPGWKNVLLTDSGFFDPFDLSKPLAPIVERFRQMVGKPFAQARVLFIPAAACDEESQMLADIMRTELLWLGFLEEHVTLYRLDSPLKEEHVLSYDVMFFTGGWCEHLLRLVKQLEFEKTVRAFVHAGRTYVGVSAGSVLATPNIMGAFEPSPCSSTNGLGFLHAYLDCHCDMQPNLTAKNLSLPHIMLHFNQALAVSSTGYELLEDPTARHAIDWTAPPVMGVDVFRKDSGLRTGAVC